jgi:hypothetical protein
VTHALNNRKLFDHALHLEFIDTPLTDAVDHLRGQSQLPLRIDAEALRAADMEVDMPITAYSPGATLLAALDAVLAPHNLGWTSDAGGIVITTAEAAHEAKRGVRELKQALPLLILVEVDW